MGSKYYSRTIYRNPNRTTFVRKTWTLCKFNRKTHNNIKEVWYQIHWNTPTPLPRVYIIIQINIWNRIHIKISSKLTYHSLWWLKHNHLHIIKLLTLKVGIGNPYTMNILKMKSQTGCSEYTNANSMTQNSNFHWFVWFA